MNNRQVIDKALNAVQKIRREIDDKYRDYLRISGFLNKQKFDKEQTVLRKRMDELDDFKFMLFRLEEEIGKIVE